MMGPAEFGSLALLALIDSASFGTLLIPIWLLTVPGRLRIGRILVYLGTVTLAYFALGLLLILGASALLATYGGLLHSPGFLVGQLALGVALVILSDRMDSKKARARATERAAAGGGRPLRWRNRIMSDAETDAGSAAALAGLALTAVIVEAASMLPYLAAIGIITAQGPGFPVSGLLLLGYCVVMISPAIVLTVGRIAARDLVEGPLEKLEHWLTKHATSTTAWIIGVVGVLLGLNAIYDLGWTGT